MCQGLETTGITRYQVRQSPFDVTGIHNAVYQRKIEEDGCCGSKEYMKLWVYSLTKHKMAIHLDIDTLLLQPIDDIWDAMLDPNKGKVLQTEPSSLYQPNGEHINFMFTRDYAMDLRSSRPMRPTGTKSRPSGVYRVDFLSWSPLNGPWLRLSVL
jgi:hypothetical protein